MADGTRPRVTPSNHLESQDESVISQDDSGGEGTSSLAPTKVHKYIFNLSLKDWSH
jgi:hypothetical protein